MIHHVVCPGGSPDGGIVEVPARAGPVQQPEVQSSHAQLLETLPQLRVTPRLAARCHAHEAAPQLGLDKHLHNTLEKIERLLSTSFLITSCLHMKLGLFDSSQKVVST